MLDLRSNGMRLLYDGRTQTLKVHACNVLPRDVMSLQAIHAYTPSRTAYSINKYVNNHTTNDAL